MYHHVCRLNAEKHSLRSSPRNVEGNSRPKYLLKSQLDEVYAATGVPRVEVSIDVEPDVKLDGTDERYPRQHSHIARSQIRDS